MLRPEAIRVVAAEGAELCGRVDAVSFVGDRQRLTVTGVAERPLTIDVANSLAVEIGQHIGLAIEPDAMRLLPGDRR
jgi:putative spermidine/putrescine transport system ATP-binding protein